MILMRMFDAVDRGLVTAPLFDPAQVADPKMDNRLFVREYVCDLLARAFPHLQA